MRGRSAQFLGLQSYHLKMVLFHVMDQFPFDSQWTDDKTGQRLIDVLLQMHECLDRGQLPNYFNRHLNLLKLSFEARTNLKNQIYRLVTNEKRTNDFPDPEFSYWQ